MSGRSIFQRHADGDHGAIAILMALFMVVFVVLVAFSVDYGVAYAQRRALSTGSDSAALAIAQAYQQVAAANPGWSCDQVRAASTVQAQSIANTYMASNAYKGSVVAPVTVSCVSPSSGQPVQVGSPAVLLVSVDASRQVASIFGGIVGVSGYHIERTAAAAVGPAGTITGLRPFGVCQTDANALEGSGVGSYGLISDSNSGTACGQASGNWGTLTLPGITNNGNGQPSQCGNNLRSAILYGDCNPIAINGSTLPISGNPGFPSGNSIDAELNAIIGLPIVLPVYSSVSGNGANTIYSTVGFITVHLCAWWSGKNSSGTVPTGAGANCYNTAAAYRPVTLDPSTDYLQLQYVSFIPLSEVSTICGLGGLTSQCSSRPTSIQLVS
jgi:Flp pilus assembly protein TadG